MSSIVIVAEGAAKGSDVADYIKTHTYLETNLTVLGYVQRGGARQQGCDHGKLIL